MARDTRAKPAAGARWEQGHAALSQGNAFTLPSGLTWSKVTASHDSSQSATARVDKSHAKGIDPGAFRGISQKSDENLRVRAEQQRAARARSKA